MSSVEQLLHSAREEATLQRIRTGRKALDYAILFNLVALALQFGRAAGPGLIFGIVALAAGAAGMLSALSGLGYSGRSRVFFVLLLAVPPLNILAEAYLSRSAGERLRQAGYDVGWFKVSAQPTARRVDLEAGAEPDAPVPSDPVLPCIKTAAFAAAFSGLAGMGGGQMPITLPLAGDLRVAFTVGAGAGLMFLTPAECARRKLDQAQLLPQARRNAIAAIKALQIKRGDKVFQLVGDDAARDMEACSLLFPEFWNAVAARLRDAPLAIFPHRNQVYFTAEHSSEGVAALQQIAGAAQFRQANALSRGLYLFKDGQWQVYTAEPAAVT
jgi:hypothetical protein